MGEASGAERESLLCEPQEPNHTVGRPEDPGTLRLKSKDWNHIAHIVTLSHCPHFHFVTLSHCHIVKSSYWNHIPHFVRVNYRRSLCQQVVYSLKFETEVPIYWFGVLVGQNPYYRCSTNDLGMCSLQEVLHLCMAWPLIVLGWEMRFTEDHVRYFVDHNTRLSHLSFLRFDTFNPSYDRNLEWAMSNLWSNTPTGQQPLKTHDQGAQRRVQKEHTGCPLSMRGPSGATSHFDLLSLVLWSNPTS